MTNTELATLTRQVWTRADADALVSIAESLGHKAKVQRKAMTHADRFTVTVRLPGRSTADLLTQRHALTQAWKEVQS